MRDIWNRDAETWVVIPTNCGWKGWHGAYIAVMGAGLAKQALDRYPDVAAFYGPLCFARYKASLSNNGPLALYEPGKLILFPTKPLNPHRPELSWRGPACLETIEEHANALAWMLHRGEVKGKVLVPALGCGLGGLNIRDVAPVLEVLRSQGDVVFLWEYA